MKNLAGVETCDEAIRAELFIAEIPGELVIPDPVHHEVPFSYIGRLGPFKLWRAWYYWVVEGRVPLDAANEMYAHEYGRRDVRVAGHCGCPSPDEWSHGGFVDGYHIDTQAGLCLFARTIRKHCLDNS